MLETMSGSCEDTCAALSRAGNEPLLGTGNDSITRWLMVEVRAPWSPKIPGSDPRQVDNMGDAALQRLLELAAAHNVRLQFIRRPRRTGPRTLLWVAGEQGQTQVARFEFDSLRSVADLRTEALEAALGPSDPLYFVCTHGRRDPCCAREGLPTYRALRERVGDRVWQTSHLGGHRFAPVVLWLPQNYLLGRVTAQDVDTVLDCTESSLLPPVEFVRGRNCLTPAEQAAECLLRSESPSSAAQRPWAVRSTAQHDDRVVVRFETEHGEREIGVAQRGPSLSVISSCGDEPKARRAWTRVTH